MEYGWDLYAPISCLQPPRNDRDYGGVSLADPQLALTPSDQHARRSAQVSTLSRRSGDSSGPTRDYPNAPPAAPASTTVGTGRRTPLVAVLLLPVTAGIALIRAAVVPISVDTRVSGCRKGEVCAADQRRCDRNNSQDLFHGGSLLFQISAAEVVGDHHHHLTPQQGEKYVKRRL
jgi:hypothetical protein